MFNFINIHCDKDFIYANVFEEGTDTLYKVKISRKDAGYYCVPSVEDDYWLRKAICNVCIKLDEEGNLPNHLTVAWH